MKKKYKEKKQMKTMKINPDPFLPDFFSSGYKKHIFVRLF